MTTEMQHHPSSSSSSSSTTISSSSSSSSSGNHPHHHHQNPITQKVGNLFEDYARYQKESCGCKAWEETLCERCSRLQPFEHLVEGLPKASFQALQSLFQAFVDVIVPVLSRYKGEISRFAPLFSTLISLEDRLVWAPKAKDHAHIVAYQNLLCQLMSFLGSGIVKPIVERAVAQLTLVKNHSSSDTRPLAPGSPSTAPPQTGMFPASAASTSFTDESIIRSTSEISARYSNAIRLLHTITTQMPQWNNLVGSCLITHFRIETMSINQCSAYLKNLFRISTFSTDMQEMVLNLVVERLMNLDSKLKLNSDALAAFNEDCHKASLSRASTPGSPIIGSPLSVSPSPSAHENYLQQHLGSHSRTGINNIDDFVLNSESEAALTEQGKLIYLAEKLDRCMKIVFDYLHRCSKLDNRQQVMKNIFANFIDIFNKSILRTYELNSTQFIMFYICSFDRRFGQHFLEFLFEKIFDNNMYPEARRVSIAYAGSFLARAKFLDDKVVLQSIEKMVTWMKNYVDNYGSTITEINVDHHAVFYHVAQCLFYVLCYHIDKLQEDANPDYVHRNAQQPQPQVYATGSLSIMDSSSSFDMNGMKPLVVHPFLEQLSGPLEEVIRSPLNPLRIIPKDVTQQIVRALYFYKIVDCSEVVRKNLVLPVRNKRRSKFLQRAYFPFDPYVLRESREFIEPIYSQWVSPTYTFSEEIENQFRLTLDNRSNPSTHINIDSGNGSNTPTRRTASQARPFMVPDRRQDVIVGSMDESYHHPVEEDSFSLSDEDVFMDDTSDDEDLDDDSLNGDQMNTDVFGFQAHEILSPSF